jgi:hypothetical protein
VDGSPLARVAWACCEAGRCCHVSGLSTRRTYAAGPNAFRGTDPDHKHAFEDALAKLGCSIPGTDRLFALHSVRPSQPVAWEFVIDTALRLRQTLKDEGLQPWPKLAGGKGFAPDGAACSDDRPRPGASLREVDRASRSGAEATVYRSGAVATRRTGRRELDDALGLTEIATARLLDGRRGKNTRHGAERVVPPSDVRSARRLRGCQRC